MPLHGTPFQPGNKFGGRPKGSPNKVTLPARRLLNEHAEALTRKCIASALRGDMKAMALCFRPLLSNSGKATKLKLPPIETADNIATALDVVLRAVAAGKCTPVEGQVLVSLLEAKRRLIEDRDFAARVAELEKIVKESSS